MIITELHGRIGNSMFLIAVGLYLSKKTNSEFAIKLGETKCRHNYYINDIINKEFFKTFNYVPNTFNDENYTKTSINKHIYSLKDFKLQDNQIIDGWYLGKNFVDYNIIKDIYVPSNELKEEIFDNYNPTKKSLSINVRRGDFLLQKNIDGGWQTLPAEYFYNAIKLLDRQYDKIFITSDDIKWCTENLDLPNVVFVDKKSSISKIFVDLFLPTFCIDNIISPSTFSWWGSYLNNSKNKQVIMPYPWNTIISNRRNKLYYYDNAILFDTKLYKKINE